jgi:hypothetical protein
MSFQSKEPSTFIDIKLTDTGRRMLASGNLKFDKVVLSDREIDYSVISRGNYNPLNNRIIAPKDYHPDLRKNFDGSTFIKLNENTIKTTQLVITASTSVAGFFTGNTNSWSLNTSKYKKAATVTAIDSTINKITFGSLGGYVPSENDLVYIPWEPDSVTGSSSSSPTILSGRPINGLWYRITSAVSATAYIVDRQIPYFSSLRTVPSYFFPFSANTYYWSSYTSDSRIWAMNITRTSDVEGTWGTTSGYTTYGSVEFNGSKHFFGLDNGDYPSIGVIHYTNRYTGNTYAEQFVEKSFRMDLPTLLWHNINQGAGNAVEFGLILYDQYGGTHFDNIANTTYRELRDGTTINSLTVGRVYHKLKMIVITDQELLNAMTYKSNRAFTLPQLNIDLTTIPPYGFFASGATASTYSSSGSAITSNNLLVNGLSKSGHSYYITYMFDSVSANTGSYETFGYPNGLHCGYIKKIDGDFDQFGQAKFIRARFERGFPYMRSSPSSDGTGWVAHNFNILIQEVNNDEINNTIDSISPNKWRKMFTNGMYSASTSSACINPQILSNAEFVLTQEDYNSSSFYYLPNTITTNQNYLNFGSESFLFGNINVDIMSTVYKSNVFVMMDSNRFNSSENTSYVGANNKYTYVTEIIILDNHNNIVGVAKPTYPIKKNELAFVGFQLEMDF